MKKMKFTLRLLLFLLAGFMINSEIFAQSVTVDIPGDYSAVDEAISANAATATQITVNIAEGILEENYHHFWAWDADLEIIVQGAGADKTFIQPEGITEMPDINTDTTNHWWQLNPSSAPNYKGSITFKDLTFRYWGKPGNRGIFMLQKHANAIDPLIEMHFVNVIFDSNIGNSLFMIDWMDVYGLHFDNCLFIDNITTPGLGGDGGANTALLQLRHHRAEKGRTNSIKNCTFYNNNAYRNETSGDMGRLISIAGWGGRESYMHMENIVAVENNLIGDPEPGIHPLIAMHVSDDNLGSDFLLSEVVSIGNIRPDSALDFDVLISGFDHDLLIFEEDGNWLQRAAKKVATEDPDDPEADPTITYEPIEDWWFSNIHPGFTYTHGALDFNMDGDKPALLEDEHGIGYVSYIVTSIDKEQAKASTLSILSGKGKMVVEGLKVNDLLHIYDITGKVVKVVTPRGSDRVEVTLPKGIYIVKSLARANEKAQKVLVL